MGGMNMIMGGPPQGWDENYNRAVAFRVMNMIMGLAAGVRVVRVVRVMNMIMGLVAGVRVV